MQIITSQKLIQKYPGQDVNGLLNKFGGKVDILPSGDYNSVKAFCDTINEEILIIGNDDVISFGQVQNPATDPDNVVYTDNCYACTQDSSFLLPNKIIARIPDEMNAPTWDYLQTVINNQIKWQSTKGTNQGWLNVVASVWKGISDYFNSEFNMQNQYVSPPSTNATWNPSLINKKYAYLNTHGAQTTPFLYGQQGSSYPIVMNPTQGYFSQTVAWFDACYGGWTINRVKEQSIPMMALYSNAVATFNSTSVAYGPSLPPAEGIDGLFEATIKRIINGEAFGSALMNGKKDFAALMMQRNGGLDGANRKTLLETHIYGNPLITI